MRTILISNSFPFSLIRRSVSVSPSSVENLLTAMHENQWISVWGHENTVALASAITGADLRPKTVRPALLLDKNLLPFLDGQSFQQVWLLSPDYTPGYRPAIGQEVPAETIKAWQVLQIEWLPS